MGINFPSYFGSLWLPILWPIFISFLRARFATKQNFSIAIVASNSTRATESERYQPDAPVVVMEIELTWMNFGDAAELFSQDLRADGDVKYGHAATFFVSLWTITTLSPQGWSLEQMETTSSPVF